jgi:hypothetical protein
MGLAVGLTLAGRLTDTFGRRWFFIAGTALGCIGAIVASTAKTINVLIGGQVLIWTKRFYRLQLCLRDRRACPSEAEIHLQLGHLHLFFPDGRLWCCDIDGIYSQDKRRLAMGLLSPNHPERSHLCTIRNFLPPTNFPPETRKRPRSKISTYFRLG